MATDSADGRGSLLRLLERALDLPAAERAAFLLARVPDEQAAKALEMLAVAESATDVVPTGSFGTTVPLGIDRTGQSLGAYRIESLLGQGGMGQVYRAVRDDGVVEAEVAIKIIRHYALTEAAVRQFKVERQILADLAHPNITRLLDGGTTPDGLPYVVTELVDGQPLNEYLRAQRPTLEQRLALFLQIAAGVGYAHRNLIIHRDLKPSNILVTSDGTVKLLDFGIAKSLTPADADAAEQTVAMIMTPSYASPEQIRGDTLDGGTDIYSLGLILFECITGTPYHRFANLSRREIDEQLATATSTRPSARIRPDDPALARLLEGDLDAVVGKALAAESSRRYPSVQALCDDIERYRNRQPVRARPDSLGYRMARFASRHRWGVGAGVTALAALVAALGISLWQTSIANEQLERAETISRFMGNVLLSPASRWDVRFAAGPDARMSEVLDIAGEHVLSDLADNPRIQIELLAGVSTALSRLSKTQQALRFSEQAVALLAAEPDIPVDLAVRALSVHGSNVAFARDLAQGFDYLAEAKHLAESAGIHATLRYVYLLNDMAKAHGELGDFGGCVKLLEEAIAIFSRLEPDPMHPALAAGYTNLGGCTGNAGDLARARELFDRAAVIAAAPEHGDEVIRGYLYNDFALLELVELDLEQAATYADTAVAEMARLTGESSLTYALALSRRALVAAIAGDATAAEQWAERALAVDPGFRLPEAQLALARAAMTRGEYAAAAATLGIAEEPAPIQILQEALAVFESGLSLWLRGRPEAGSRLMQHSYAWTRDRFDGAFLAYFQRRWQEEGVEFAAQSAASSLGGR